MTRYIILFIVLASLLLGTISLSAYPKYYSYEQASLYGLFAVIALLGVIALTVERINDDVDHQ